MITILFVVSQFIQPSTIFDTSNAALSDEAFLFNDIKEKSISTVKISGSCSDLSFNLQELKQFAQTFAAQRNYRLVYNYNIASPCNDATRTTSFYLALTSPRASADSTFTANSAS